MNILSTGSRDMLHSLSWYMTARKSSLRAALSFRVPLSVNDQMDLMVHYSAYFLNLLGATELCREASSLPPKVFEKALYARLVFDGFPDGEANYSYIRELRNSIVHRGLDITASAHFDGTFPLIVAEPKVNDRNGKKAYFSFDKYLPHLIEKCESVVGVVMLDCLKAASLLESVIDPVVAAFEHFDCVKRSQVLPESVKEMVVQLGFNEEWSEAAHNTAIAKLLSALAPFDTSCSFSSNFHQSWEL